MLGWTRPLPGDGPLHELFRKPPPFIDSLDQQVIRLHVCFADACQYAANARWGASDDTAGKFRSALAS